MVILSGIKNSAEIGKEFAMTREFELDLSIRGIYDESTYELEAVEEALAEWNLTFPDEYG